MPCATLAPSVAEVKSTRGLDAMRCHPRHYAEGSIGTTNEQYVRPVVRARIRRQAHAIDLDERGAEIGCLRFDIDASIVDGIDEADLGRDSRNPADASIPRRRGHLADEADMPVGSIRRCASDGVGEAAGHPQGTGRKDEPKW